MQAFEELVRKILDTPELLHTGSTEQKQSQKINLGHAKLPATFSACACS
jgi:hypothetical protein